MLVYDAQNEESQQKVDSLKTEINTEQLQGKKPSIFVVENRSNSSGNYSSLKVCMPSGLKDTLIGSDRSNHRP